MALAGKIPVGRDIFERFLKSFVQGAATVALAQGINLANIVHLDFWKALGFGGITAVLSLVTSVISLGIGKKGASADPAVGLAPEPVPARTP
jgi:hypothetical protein